MKRTALARRTPLTRKTPLRPRSRTKKYARRDRDHDYMRFIRWCSCALKDAKDATCNGHTEADHQGVRPLGQKAPDTTCVPMCVRHHRHRTDLVGYFKGWDAARMRAWCDQKIHFYQNLYKNLLQLRQTPWRRKVA